MSYVRGGEWRGQNPTKSRQENYLKKPGRGVIGLASLGVFTYDGLDKEFFEKSRRGIGWWTR